MLKEAWSKTWLSFPLYSYLYFAQLIYFSVKIEIEDVEEKKGVYRKGTFMKTRKVS